MEILKTISLTITRPMHDLYHNSFKHINYLGKHSALHSQSSMWNSCIILLCSYSILSDGCKLLNPGRFTLKPERLEQCPGMPPISEQQIPVYLKIQKHNRTTVVVDANVTLLRDLDESYDLHVRYARWGDGGWKENWIQFRRHDACHAMIYLLGKFWTGLIAASNYKAPPRCPAPKGFYKVDHYLPELDKIMVPLCEGQIKVEFKALRNEEVCVCKLFYLSVESIL